MKKSRLLWIGGITLLLLINNTNASTLIESLTISSTNPNPVYTNIPLDTGKPYTLVMEGVYYWGGSAPSQYVGDGAYLSEDDWVTLRTDVGIRATTPKANIGVPAVGAGALYADIGSGIQIIDWGDYNTSHNYSFDFISSSTTIGFVISDWWGDEYGTFCQFQSCMNDNFGWLSVSVYSQPVPIPPALWLFGSGLLGLIGIARKKAA